MAKRKNKLIWESFSSKDRIQVIELIKKEINTHDGYITHFNRFSDLSISFLIEMEEYRITAFYQALANIMSITENMPEGLNPNSSVEWNVFLNVSFSKGSGNLTIEIPKVPG